MTFAELLKQWLPGHTQVALALAVGVRESTVSRWKTDKAIPKLGWARRIAEAMGQGYSEARVRKAIEASHRAREQLEPDPSPNALETRMDKLEAQVLARMDQYGAEIRELKAALEGQADGHAEPDTP